MKSIRDYINLVNEANWTDGSGNPIKSGSGQPVQSGTPNPPTPTPKPQVTPAADASAPLAVPPGAEPDAAPEAAATGLAEPTDADVAAAAAPATPAGAPGAQDDATGVDAAVAAQAAAGQGAQPAAPNFDTMPFGKAFAAAKQAGMADFMWKGKKYAVKMAGPKQGAQPKPTVGQMPMKQQAAVAAGTDPNAVTPQGMAFGGGGLEESTGYNEFERLVSLVHYK